jgi:tetratricopeptide (TPR) repeat protein
MKHRFLILFLLFAYALGSAQEEKIAPVAVEPHWQVGDKKLLEIVQGKLRYDDGKMLPSDQVRVSIVEIEVLEERALGYRMQWTFRQSKVIGASNPYDLSQILSNGPGARLEFYTDRLGGFLQISNWAEIQERLTREFAATFPRLQQYLPEAEAKEITDLLIALAADRSRIEPFLLKEIQLFHRPYGYWLRPNETFTSEGTLENPWGKPLPATLSVRWQEPEQKHTEAFVQLVQRIDMNKKDTRRMLEEVMDNLNVSGEGMTASDQPIQLLDSSNYVYNLKSGWLESSIYRRFEEGQNELLVRFCDMRLMPYEAEVNVEKLWASSIEKYRQMDLRGALADLEQAIKISPSSAAYNLRALILSAMGNNDAAIADFARSIELKPLAWTYAHRAEVRMRMEDYSGAEADFQKALLLDSTDADVYFLRARMWENRLRYEEGMQDMNSLIRLSPRNAHAYAYRAFLKREQGMLDAALKDIERAARLAPLDPLVFRHKGLIHLSLGEEVSACQAFERALWLGFTEQYDDEVERIMKAFCK